MNVTDEISDLLCRVKNAQMARHKKVVVPASKLKQAICELLEREGFIGHVARVEDQRQGLLEFDLKYDEDKVGVLRGVKRVSTPGRRIYCGAKQVLLMRQGLGITIVSTSSGLLTDKEARERNIGGELICQVW